ncbi:MAG: hypothetical protein WC897_04175 [Candidatus Gracilibacteria bacterium]
MNIEQDPVKLDIVGCKSSLDLHIVKLRVSISDAVRTQFGSDNSTPIPFQLVWGGKADEFTMPGSGAFEGQMDFRLPVSEVGTLKVQFSLPNGSIVESTGSIPPVEEYRTDFADRVAHGEPIKDGEHFSIPEGVYAFDKNLIVCKGAILQVDPGAQFLFAPGVGVYSEGTLLFRGGGHDKPIYLRAKDAGKGWSGVVLNGPYTAFSTFEACAFQDGLGMPVYNRGGKLFIDPKSDLRYGGNLSVMNIANLECPIRLEDVTFRDGRADRGGGLSVYNSAVSLSKVHFIENRAKLSGGGLHVEHGVVGMKEEIVSFNKNHADLTGGAFAFTHGSRVNGARPTVVDNTVGKRGRDGFVLNSDMDLSSWTMDVFAINQLK